MCWSRMASKLAAHVSDPEPAVFAGEVVRCLMDLDGDGASDGDGARPLGSRALAGRRHAVLFWAEVCPRWRQSARAACTTPGAVCSRRCGRRPCELCRAARRPRRRRASTSSEELESRVVAQVSLAMALDITGQHWEKLESRVMTQVAQQVAQEANNSTAQAVTLQDLQGLEGRLMTQVAQHVAQEARKSVMPVLEELASRVMAQRMLR